VAALKKLVDAGIRASVLVAPVIPGLSDSPQQLADVTDACLEAGARSVTAIPLHLRPGVREHFMGWLRQHQPELAPRFERHYRRSYLAPSDQERITGFVADRVIRHQGPT
jgi:DNA repair photolyase